MKGATGDRWRELCAKAAAEQDPQKLLAVTAEIIRLLDEKERRLQQQANATENSNRPIKE